MKNKRYSFKKIGYKKKEKETLEPLFKRQGVIIALSVLLVVIITLTGSLAVFTKVSEGNEYNVVQVGELELSYVDLNDEGNVLGLADNYPISDTDGETSTPYRFSVENTGTIIADYTVKIIQDTDTIDADGCSDNLIDDSYLRYKFDNDASGNLSDKLDATTKEYVIYSGTLEPNESNIHEIRLWINENSPNSILGTHYHGKVVIEVTQNNATDPYERPVAKSIVFDTAASNLGENCKTYDDGTDTFLVGQCSNNYVWYSGKLWRVVLKNNETGAIKMITDNAITAIPYNASGNTTFENSYMDQWLNQEFLPTLHDYEDYLVVDSDWYATTDSTNEIYGDSPSSGDGPSSGGGPSSGDGPSPANSLYSDDITDSNNIGVVLPISNSNNLLLRPATSKIKRTIGLLNAYEYYTIFNNSDGLASFKTAYLNKFDSNGRGTNWWLLTAHDQTSMWYSSADDGLLHANLSDGFGYGVRPVVNLKPSVGILSGTGSQDNPYMLDVNDEKIVNGTTLLSSRYSGEYLTFNNELYRIVNVENGLTKIVAVDAPDSLSSLKWNGYSRYSGSEIKSSLEEYYYNLEISDRLSYNMIEPDTIWYFGTVDVVDSYKRGICSNYDNSTSIADCEKIVDSSYITTDSIALLRVGEMFSSQIGRTLLKSYWLINSGADSSDSITIPYRLDYNGYIYPNSPNSLLYVRPSMYLKSNIVIASNNTGNGTYEKPYSIEQNIEELITFTAVDKMMGTSVGEFKVPKGLTWGEFINSEYNVSNDYGYSFSLDSEGNVISQQLYSMGYVFTSYDAMSGTFVYAKSSDTIIENHNYIIYDPINSGSPEEPEESTE